MIAANETDRFKMEIIMQIGRLCEGGVSILLFGGVMQVCLGALLCRCHPHTAHHQLVRLCWGYLGGDICVPLPSCAVLRIREEYPLEDYGGFHEVQQ